jgi:hypothetical protein
VIARPVAARPTFHFRRLGPPQYHLAFLCILIYLSFEWPFYIAHEPSQSILSRKFCALAGCFNSWRLYRVLQIAIIVIQFRDQYEYLFSEKKTRKYDAGTDAASSQLAAL